MFRHEWYKLWHNRRLVGIVLLLVLLNCGYFAYRETHAAQPSNAYRAMQADLSEMSDEEASAYLQQEYAKVRSIMYREPYEGEGDAEPRKRYCDNLWTEMSLYSEMQREYEDILTYPAYLKGILEAPKKYHVLKTFSVVNDRMIRNVDKTAEDYSALSGITLTRTQTKGINRALALPSVPFLEILLAVLFVSVVLVREGAGSVVSVRYDAEWTRAAPRCEARRSVARDRDREPAAARLHDPHGVHPLWHAGGRRLVAAAAVGAGI